MKLPRDVSSDRLIKLLQDLGYEVVRQRGSHVRLSYEGKHFITVPAHRRLKTGLLKAILKDVASYHEISIEELIRKL